MSDTPDTETPPWEFQEMGLVVLPDISWEEWTSLYDTVSELHKKSLWYLGDCLCSGEARFSEQYAQVLDGYSAETIKSAKWVASRFPFERRRKGLSWSVHRAVSSLSTEEQEAMLDRVVSEGWRSKQTEAEVKEYKAKKAAEKDAARQARRNAHAPEEQVLPEEEQHHSGKFYNADPDEVTRVTDSLLDRAIDALDEDIAAREATEAEAIRGRNTPPEAEEPSPASSPVASEPLEDPAEELRSIIEGIRWVENDLVLGKADLQSVQDLERRTLLALGRPMYSASPLRTDMPAESLIPPEWSVKIEGGEFVFGARKWTVELRKGNQRAIGVGPSLACAVTEAVLAAALSTLTAAKR